MTALILIPIFIVIAAAMWEFASFKSYDGYASTKTQKNYMDLNPMDLKLNMYNKKILSWNSLAYDFISYAPSILCKYYINDVGMVPRWSKLHKKINEYYKIANNKL